MSYSLRAPYQVWHFIEISWESQRKLTEISVKKLKFMPREALRYNQFIAQIRVNFIASRGEGVDYMLSANNTKKATEAFNKMRYVLSRCIRRCRCGYGMAGCIMTWCQGVLFWDGRVGPRTEGTYGLCEYRVTSQMSSWHLPHPTPIWHTISREFKHMSSWQVTYRCHIDTCQVIDETLEYNTRVLQMPEEERNKELLISKKWILTEDQIKELHLCRKMGDVRWRHQKCQNDICQVNASLKPASNVNEGDLRATKMR